MKKIIPAILTKEVADLEHKLRQLEGLTDWVQIDIMDGKFVNNTSIFIEDILRAHIAKNFSFVRETFCRPFISCHSAFK